MGGKLWTAAGIYAGWRLILKPVLKAGALLTKAGILLPVAIVHDVSRSVTVTPKPITGKTSRWDGAGRPESRWPRPKSPAPAPSQAPANAGTGDWRQDKETLRRLIAEGQIRTGR
jgi:hypothetical protein